MHLQPKIESMASGNLSLTLTEEASWESFPDFATNFLRLVGGKRIKKVDTPVERLWVVLVKWRPFFLTYEDFPNRITLDAMHRSCNSVIRKLHEQLSKTRRTDA
jgi:uncharacterized protein DUF3630